METTADDLLSFKEFPLIQETSGTSAQININSPQRTLSSIDRQDEDTPNGTCLTLSNTINSANVRLALRGGIGKGDTSAKSSSIFSFEYYQKFFDVDTMIVVDRIATSMIPKRAPSNYLRLKIATNPDLYGPVWIVLTLIFAIAISGNMASYLQNTGDHHWRYNFHLVSYSATAILLYTIVVPCALWAFLKWSTQPTDLDDEEDEPLTPSLLSLVCIYGYSLAIYIPVSVLWTIQVSLFQWLLVITGAFLSGFALLTILMPAIKKSKYSLFVVLAIEVAHFALAAGFMLYFFHAPDSVVGPVEEPVHKAVTSVVVNTTVHKSA